MKVERLSDRLGGGFVAYAPALKGCLADGATPDEALDNLHDAIQCWLDTARAKGRQIPPAITALEGQHTRVSPSNEEAEMR